MIEVVIDRTQAQIDACLRRKAFRSDSERIERGEHCRLALGVEREVSALLDQGPCQRLDKDALRQLQLARLAAALIAGLVAGGERQHHIGAGPRMLGQIMRRLRGARACPLLRQDERIIGRAEQRAWRFV